MDEVKKPRTLIEKLVMADEVITNLSYLGFDFIKIKGQQIILFVPEKNIDAVKAELKDYMDIHREKYLFRGYVIQILSFEKYLHAETTQLELQNTLEKLRKSLVSYLKFKFKKQPI